MSRLKLKYLILIASVTPVGVSSVVALMLLEKGAPQTRGGILWVAALGIVLALGAEMGMALTAWAQDRKVGYQDTPLLPGGKWHVHDGTRPQPGPRA